MNTTIVMPILGAIAAPWQHHESLWTTFPEHIVANKDFLVLLSITSLNVMYYDFARSLHYIQVIDAYQDETSSTDVN